MNNRKTMRRIMIALCVLSALIYILQIVIFKDPKTTFFYLFQDLAFLPVSIAIATVAVGAVLDEREKNERIAATRMLRSSFFTSIGAVMIRQMMEGVAEKEKVKEVHPLLQGLGAQSSMKQIQQRQQQILSADIRITLNQKIYDGVNQMIVDEHTDLLVLSSNSSLLEAECFTKMLWGIFHLYDEYRLRGSYEKLSRSDIEHLESDFSDVFRLLLANSVENTCWLAKTYPNFYGTVKEKIRKGRTHENI